MANFEFDQGEQQFIVQTLNPTGEGRLPATSQSLPSVSQAVGPLPSVGIALNQVQVSQPALNPVSQPSINQDALTAETTVAQQLSDISDCDSSINRDRSASPKFIQLTNMATLANASQQGLNIKQESASPPINQQLSQVPLQQYAFVPSHNHFVSQQLSPTNVTTSVSPLTTNNNQILPQQQIIHNLAAQICPQVPQQQHQQPQQQQQHLIQQQHQPQILHQMQQSQPILQQIQAQQLTPQHQQIQQQQQQQTQQLQQQQFQQFQNQMQEYNQHQLVQIMNNNSTLQRTQTSTGQSLQDPMSQAFLQQPLNIGDNLDKSHSKSRKRMQQNSEDGDTSDPMDDTHSAMPIKKRPHQVPDDLKDDAYWEKRKKNNDSARRSREARRVKEEQVAMRVVYLENENLQLRTEVTILKTEIEKLRGMLYE